MSDKHNHVTLEDVFRAADAIAADGGRPSVRNIQAQLGGGSPNTVTPHLRAWREHQEQKSAGDVPPALLKAISTHVQDVAARKTNALTDRLASVEEDLDHLAVTTTAAEEKARLLEVELASTRESLARSQASGDDLTHQLQSSREQLAEVNGELRSTLEKLARQSAQAEASESLAAAANLRADYLQQQLDSATASVEEVRASKAELEGKLAAAVATNENLQIRIDDLTRSLQQSTRAETELNVGLRHSLQSLNEQLETERKARLALEQRLLDLAGA